MNYSFWSNKTVFITGHTGFKGSWLTLWLNLLGSKVIGYALDPPTNPSLFYAARVNEKMTSIYGNVCDHKLLRDTLTHYQPDIVFHLAAQSLVGKSYQVPLETFETNLMGTVNILNAMRDVPNIQAFVNVTSDKCYENQEWVWGYRENDPLGGFDPYSCSKSCSELITASFRKSYFAGENQIKIATARAGNVIGGGDWASHRLIPDCINALMANQDIVLRNPQAIRPWQHVLEALSGYLTLVEKMSTHGVFTEAWNFGPDNTDTTTVQWIVDNLVAQWGSYQGSIIVRPIEEIETSLLTLDSSKARMFLEWNPRWTVEAALLRTIDWYKAWKQDNDMQKFTLRQIEDYMGS